MKILNFFKKLFFPHSYNIDEENRKKVEDELKKSSLKSTTIKDNGHTCGGSYYGGCNYIPTCNYSQAYREYCGQSSSNGNYSHSE